MGRLSSYVSKVDPPRGSVESRALMIDKRLDFVGSMGEGYMDDRTDEVRTVNFMMHLLMHHLGRMNGRMTDSRWTDQTDEGHTEEGQTIIVIMRHIGRTNPRLTNGRWMDCGFNDASFRSLKSVFDDASFRLAELALNDASVTLWNSHTTYEVHFILMVVPEVLCN